MLSFTLNHCILGGSFGSFVTKNSIDGTDAGSVFPITNAFFDEAISNLPRKDGWVLLFVLHNFGNNWRRCNLWLTPPYRSRTNRSCFVESAQDFADAAVRHQKSTRNFAGSDTACCKLHDPMTNVIREGPTVHERSSELIYPTVTLEEKRRCQSNRQKEWTLVIKSFIRSSTFKFLYWRKLNPLQNVRIQPGDEWLLLARKSVTFSIRRRRPLESKTFEPQHRVCWRILFAQTNFKCFAIKNNTIKQEPYKAGCIIQDKKARRKGLCWFL